MVRRKSIISLKSRPIWFNDLSDKITDIKTNQSVYTESKSAKKNLSWYFGSIKPVAIA